MGSRIEATRTGTTSQVGSLEEALEHIRPTVESGHVWLRGQVHPWPPSSSLARLELSGGSEARSSAEASLAHFLDWVRTQQDVRTDLDSDQKAIATAQHYGIATNFLDFTLSPDVAAFFATDTQEEPPGSLACIYLLDLEELAECFMSQPQEVAEALQLYPVLDRVANLWRLETQRGVFLHAPGRWWEWFEMDCVLFPRPAPRVDLRRSIYPRERSRLEDRIVKFLQLERMRNAAVERERTPRESEVVAEFRAVSRFVPGYVVDEPPLAPGWDNFDEAPWRRPTERYVDVVGPEIGLDRALLEAPWGLGSQFEANLILFLEDGRIDRTQSIGFRFLEDFTVLEPDHRPLVETALQRIWDGMRSLPFSDLDLARALTSCLLAATAGLGGSRMRWSGHPVSLSFSREVGEEWMELALCAADGSYARSLASVSRIRSHLRPDLADILTAKGRTIQDDPKRLFMAVQDTRLLFPFDSIVQLLATELIPTQALVLGHEASPIFFSPLELVRVGMP